MARWFARYTTRSTKHDAEMIARMANSGVERILRDEMAEAGKAGEAEAKKFIAMAGTQKRWANGPFPDLKQGGGRREQPNRGRVNTGAMRDAISYRLNAEGKGLTTVQVGWINQYEKYFSFQDEGFSSGGYRERVQDPVSAVEGMKMMAHMRFYMRDQHDKAADRAMKRISDGL